MDAGAFVSSIEKRLVPTLKSGEIVVIDDVPSHHNDRGCPIQWTGANHDSLVAYSPI